MNKALKNIIGILGFLVIVIALGAVFLKSMLNSTVAEYSDEMISENLESKVSIFRDSLGVPYIYASSERDAAFALGFVHAQERLFQMDFMRRIASGRLSEVIGTSALEFDKMFRTMNISATADSVWKYSTPFIRKLLTGYAAGVNFYIEHSTPNVPVEFDILGYKPEEWLPQHSLMVIRLLGWSQNINWFVDPAFNAVLTRLGEQKALDMHPDEDAVRKYLRKKAGPNGSRNNNAVKSRNSEALISSSIIETAVEFSREYGYGTPGTGSNNWAVNGMKAAGDLPIIANDTHMPLFAPGEWFAAVVRGGEWKAEGLSIPGAPGIVVGTNKNIAWTITNAMIDDTDFYIEQLDSTGKYYLLDNKWRPLKIRYDTIYVMDSVDYVYKIRSTHRGPLISDTHLYNITKEGILEAPAISMKWAGNRITHEMLAFYDINTAGNWEEFRSAVSGFKVPGLNFVYADRDNNIAHVYSGTAPIRPDVSTFFLYDGTSSSSDWTGYVPDEDMPVVLNPEDNFVASANYKPLNTGTSYFSYVWAHNSRINRISDLLTSAFDVTAEDFAEMQMDIKSDLAEKVVPYIQKAFEGKVIKDKNLKTALALLDEWDYRFDAFSQAPSIYSAFYRRFLQNTLQDELGKDVYDMFVFSSYIPVRSFERLLNNPGSQLFDDIKTPEYEKREDIIRRSLVDALTELELSLGDELIEWQWGRLHFVSFRHFFSGADETLNKYLNIGPFGIGGDGSTVFNTIFPLSDYEDILAVKPYDVIIGPSMRFIYDFNEPGEFRFAITTGQSGNIYSPHYNDITHYWISGKLVTIKTDKRTVWYGGNSLLTISPY